MYGLKPVPFKAKIFQRPVKPTDCFAFMAGLKSRPFKANSSNNRLKTHLCVQNFGLSI
jgi:hypothetical protein